MKTKITKLLTLAMALCAALTLSACSGGSASAEAAVEVYTTQNDFVEAGYEGDCVNTIATTLVLDGNGNYTLISNMMVNQVSGVVVYFETSFYEGTYTVDSEADGVKTITLSDATSAMVNASGVGTTSDEDATLLDGGAGQTVTCDTSSNTLTLAE